MDTEGFVKLIEFISSRLNDSSFRQYTIIEGETGKLFRYKQFEYTGDCSRMDIVIQCCIDNSLKNIPLNVFLYSNKCTTMSLQDVNIILENRARRGIVMHHEKYISLLDNITFDNCKIADGLDIRNHLGEKVVSLVNIKRSLATFLKACSLLGGSFSTNIDEIDMIEKSYSKYTGIKCTEKINEEIYNILMKPGALEYASMVDDSNDWIKQAYNNNDKTVTGFLDKLYFANIIVPLAYKIKLACNYKSKVTDDSICISI